MDKTDINNNVSTFLWNTVQALAIAVDRGFMKREHAGAIWKKLVTASGIDVKEKEVKENGMAKKD